MCLLFTLRLVAYVPAAGATSGKAVCAVVSFLLWVFYGTPYPTSILSREKGSFIHSPMGCQAAALCIHPLQATSASKTNTGPGAAVLKHFYTDSSMGSGVLGKEASPAVLELGLRVYSLGSTFPVYPWGIWWKRQSYLRAQRLTKPRAYVQYQITSVTSKGALFVCLFCFCHEWETETSGCQFSRQENRKGKLARGTSLGQTMDPWETQWVEGGSKDIEVWVWKDRDSEMAQLDHLSLSPRSHSRRWELILKSCLPTPTCTHALHDTRVLTPSIYTHAHTDLYTQAINKTEIKRHAWALETHTWIWIPAHYSSTICVSWGNFTQPLWASVSSSAKRNYLLIEM